MSKLPKILITSVFTGLAFSAVAGGSTPSVFKNDSTHIVIAQAEAIEDYNRYFMTRVMPNEDVMPMLDANGDGEVSDKEFMQAHQRVFDSMDENGDGMLSESEMMGTQ